MKMRHVAMLVLGLGAMAYWFSGDSETQETKFLFDRPWVSEVPKDPREAFHAMILSKKEKMGATIVGSRYQHLVSAVSYSLDSKDKLQLNFLQQEFKIAGKVKTFECKGPDKLDLCLEIDYRWKKLRLYSSSKWHRAKDVPSHLRFDLEGFEANECTECREGEPTWISSFE